jgi:hypothetical protein
VLCTCVSSYSFRSSVISAVCMWGTYSRAVFN